MTDTVAALETGQLVKDAYFTLFEAVGALEVRWRLDSTFIRSRTKRLIVEGL